MIEAAKRKILQILKFPNNVLFVNCVVPENIHTPHHGGNWKFRRGGGSKAQENPEERGFKRINYFQRVNFDSFRCKLQIKFENNYCRSLFWN